MKLIIVGATGYIGCAILQRAVAEPGITSIVTLSRRELPAEVLDEATAGGTAARGTAEGEEDGRRSRTAKVTNVVVADFERYGEEVVEKTRGAEACVWAVGGRVFKFPDLETARKANVDYLHAFAKTVVEQIAPAVSNKETGKKFRFVYCSGMFTEYDQDKKLYFLEESRKLKGAAESGLLEIENQHADTLQVVIARPAGVLDTNKGLKNMVYGPVGIGKGDLAAAMVDMVLNGSKQQITENTELRKMGSSLQKKN